jgi:hypothetical protein
MTAQVSTDNEQQDLDVPRISRHSSEQAAALSTTSEDGDAEEPLRSLGTRDPWNKSPAMPIDKMLVDSERVREQAEDSPSRLAIPECALDSDGGEQKSSHGRRERSTHPIRRERSTHPIRRESSLRRSSSSIDGSKPSKARSPHSRLSRREDQGDTSAHRGSWSGNPTTDRKRSSRRSSVGREGNSHDQARRSFRPSSLKDSGAYGTPRSRPSQQEMSTRRKTHGDDPQETAIAFSGQHRQREQIEIESSHSASSSSIGTSIHREDLRARGDRAKNGKLTQAVSIPEKSGRRESRRRSSKDTRDFRSHGTSVGHDAVARCDSGSNGAESLQHNASFCASDPHRPIGPQKSRRRSSVSHDASGKEDRWKLLSQELQSRSFIDILLERSKEWQTVVVEFDGHASLDHLALHSYHAGTIKKRTSKENEELDRMQRTRSMVPLDSLLTNQRSGPAPKRRGSTGTIE